MSRRRRWSPIMADGSILRVLRVGLMMLTYQWQMQLMVGDEPFSSPEVKERVWMELMRRDVQHERKLRPQRPRYPASRHRR